MVARPLHTVVVLCVLAAVVLWGYFLADQMRTSANPNRIRFYLHSLAFEWLLFAVVIAGVRRNGTPLGAVLGDRWHSLLQVLRDIGIAAAFWIVSAILLVIASWALRILALGRDLRFLYPHGTVELLLWLAVSITAGICEETIFRGYLQRQFMAITKSAPVGILISAVIFGAAHAYQGVRRALVIGLYGAMFGILAHWRKNVRPGMIAHAWQDSLAGVLAATLKRYS